MEEQAKIPSVDFTELHDILPRIMTRKDVGIYLRNIISPRYLANLDGKGLGSALKERSYRRGEDSEHIIVCRLNSDNGVYTHHIRSDVKSSSASVGRDNIFIGFYDLGDRIDKSSFGKSGHLKTGCRLIKSLGI